MISDPWYKARSHVENPGPASAGPFFVRCATAETKPRSATAERGYTSQDPGSRDYLRRPLALLLLLPLPLPFRVVLRPSPIFLANSERFLA